MVSFLNTYALKPVYKGLHFQAHKMLLSCKWSAKTHKTVSLKQVLCKGLLKFQTPRIKFKTLMFAYKTTSGSALLYLNSLLQTCVPLEACVCKCTSLSGGAIAPSETCLVTFLLALSTFSQNVRLCITTNACILVQSHVSGLDIRTARRHEASI